MRTLKTSLSVFICLIISSYFIKDGYPFYSAIAAVICMQQDIQNSLNASLNRITGTLLGGIMGIVLLSAVKILNIEYNTALYFFAIALFIIPLIYSSVFLNKKGAVNISCIVFLCITVLHGNDDTPVAFACGRMVETLIGIVVSLGVNSINPPAKPNKSILFVTDLDGTFLTPDKKVSKKSLKIINRLIEKGLLFTAATARTPATVTEILKDLKLNLPVICMNASAIYSLSENKYIHYHKLSAEAYTAVTEISARFKSTCFVHTIKDNRLYIFYDEIRNSAQEEFYNERKNLPLKTYIKQNSFPSESSDIIFLMFLDETEKINKIYNEILSSDASSKITAAKYKDIYSSGDYSFLEIYDKKASKENGVKYIKEYIGAKKVVAFGDNANDIPMLKAADCSFAVLNAAAEVKEVSDKIIGSNTTDSVAKTILYYRN